MRSDRARAVLICAAILLIAGGTVLARPGPAGIDGHVFVAPAWLAEHLDEPDVVVLHVGSAKEYEAGHVPGASLLELTEFAPERDGLAVELGDSAQLLQTLRRLGVGDESLVVLCFEKDRVALATRAWFTLDALGHGDHAAVLDGGLEAWRGAAYETSTTIPRPTARTLSSRTARPPVVDAAWVLGHLYAPGIRLIDSRPAKYYTGQDDADGRLARPGHVPGARNLPWRSLFDDGDRLLDRAELAAAFAGAQVDPGDQVVTYCGVGMAASVVYAVGRQLGFDMRIYDGSFQEWGRLRKAPVARSGQR